MKKHYYLLGVLLAVIPVIAHGEYAGEVNLGLRTTHYASDQKSAKYDEYLDQGNGLYGSGWLLYDSDTSRIETIFDTSSHLEITGESFGLLKGSLFYDDYTHNISKNGMSPAEGIGSDYLIIPDAGDPTAIPPLSSWQEFDYKVDQTNVGGEIMVAPETSPFFTRLSYEQKRSDGTRPYGTVKFTGFELPMPVDYTTNIMLAESGYRDRETALTVGLSYSDFDNGYDLLTISNGTDVQEYSMAPDNYSYTITGALRQQLPSSSQLAMDLSYTRDISETDYDSFAILTYPGPDSDFDGDVTNWQMRTALSKRFGSDLDARIHYAYIDHSNNSDEVELENSGENNPFSYDKHQAGLDLDYRVSSTDTFHSGYEFTRMNRNREYVGRSTDNRIYGQWNNTSLDWLEVKLRLEYLNRDADTDLDAATLEVNNDLIYQYFKPYDVVSKDRYSAKASFEFYPYERLELGLSYAFISDNFRDDPGLQQEQRHEIYLDASYEWTPRKKVNFYAGYEYAKSDLDNSWTSLASSPSSLVGSYLWGQDSTYGFFVFGGSLTVPVLPRLDMVMSVDYQLGDGEIDFSDSVVAGESLEPLDNADDFYKTQLGIKAIYTVNDAVSITTGYQFEKARLDEWYYDDYSYTDDAYYLSGAGLDHDYEAHQFYLVWTYRF
jgi:MtrB/PioB family decaheme-associated outer membrane protein